MSSVAIVGSLSILGLPASPAGTRSVMRSEPLVQGWRAPLPFRTAA